MHEPDPNPKTDSPDADPGIDLETVRALPDERQPPAELEARVVAELRHRGLLASRPRWRSSVRVWTQLAAALALVGSGVLAGRWSAVPEPQPNAGDLYMLLLFEPPSFGEGLDLHSEYAGWARGLAAAGRTVDGAPLSADQQVLGASDARVVMADSAGNPLELGGFFTVDATSLDEATAIAAGSPHVARGGTVVVRRLGE